MKLEEIPKIEKKAAKRLGRGTGGGHGKTSGRGHKGQKSRSGGKLRPGFEGGQLPLVQRVPKKRGFKSRRLKMTVSLASLDRFEEGTEITKELLFKEGLLKDPKAEVKIVGNKRLKGKLKTSLKISKAAAKFFEVIEKDKKKKA